MWAKTNYVIVIIGGFTACIMTKYALHHASQHPELQNQVDLRYSEVHFHRPIFASTSITLTLREVHISKEGSTLYVESLQNGKLTTSAHIRYVDCIYITRNKCLYP